MYKNLDIFGIGSGETLDENKPEKNLVTANISVGGVYILFFQSSLPHFPPPFTTPHRRHRGVAFPSLFISSSFFFLFSYCSPDLFHFNLYFLVAYLVTALVQRIIHFRPASRLVFLLQPSRGLLDRSINRLSRECVYMSRIFSFFTFLFRRWIDTLFPRQFTSIIAGISIRKNLITYAVTRST